MNRLTAFLPALAALTLLVVAASADTPLWHPFPVLPTYGAAGVYDSDHDRMLMIGGANTGQQRLEVWALPLAGGDWAPILTEGLQPGPVFEHTAIYDPVRHRVLIFSGYGGADTVRALDLSGVPTWSNLATVGPGPSARSRACAIYDPVRDRMIVFGGYQYPDLLGDVWALSLAGTPTWTQLQLDGPRPTARLSAAATYDPVRDRLVIHGGKDSSSFTTGQGPRSDVWALDLAGPLEWHQLAQFAGGADSYAGQAALYDPVRDQLLVLGGSDSTYYPTVYHDEVRTLPLTGTAAWSVLQAGTPAPIGRTEFAAIYDPLRDAVVICGGNREFADLTGETWRLDLSGSAKWTRLFPTETRGGLRFGHTAIFDAPRDRLIAFGGRFTYYVYYSYPTQYFNDLWSLTWSGDRPLWSQLLPSGTPPAPRQNAAAVFDPVRQRMLLFGGNLTTGIDFPNHYGTPHFYGDLWSLALDGPVAWSLLSPAGPAPGPRDGHALVVDPARDRLLLFGGRDSLGPKNDLWALSLADPQAWAALATQGTPPSPRSDATAFYDPAGDRLVVFGGHGSSAGVADLWQLSLGVDPPAWSPLAASGDPPAPSLHPHPGLWDPGRRQLLVLGVDEPINDLSDPLQIWKLSLDGTPAWMPVAPFGRWPATRDGATTTYDPVRRQGVMLWGAEGQFGDYAHADSWTIGLDSPTATTLSLVSATAEPGRASVVWFAAGEEPRLAVLERREDGGPWIELATLARDGGGLFRYDDLTVRDGGTYAYRLVWSSGGLEFRGEQATLTVPLREAFALAAPRPNPASLDFEVVVSLPDAMPASLELIDIGGRRLESREMGPLGPGTHVVRFGLDRRVAPGVYLLRLARRGEARVARIAVVR